MIGRGLTKAKSGRNYINLLLLKLEQLENRLNLPESQEKMNTFGMYILKKEIKKLKFLLWRVQNE